MAKKAAGPKEAELRKMREGKTEGGNGTGKVEIPEDVQAEIEAEEQRLREQFEADLTKKREHLVRVATLKAERGQVQKDWNAAEERLRAIDKELGKLTGKEVSHPTSGKGSRTTFSDEELQNAGKAIFAVMNKSRKNEFSRKELEAAITKKNGKTPVLKKVIEVWNKSAEKADTIHHNGKEKTLSRYLLH